MNRARSESGLESPTGGDRFGRRTRLNLDRQLRCEISFLGVPQREQNRAPGTMENCKRSTPGNSGLTLSTSVWVGGR